FSIGPFLHADEAEGVVACANQAQQAEPRDCRDVLDAGNRRSYLLQLGDYFFGSLQRGGVRQLNVDVEVSLILIRNEAGGQSASDPDARCAETRKQNQRDRALAENRSGDTDISLSRPAENAIEPAEELCQRSPARPSRLQNQRRERWTQ